MATASNKYQRAWVEKLNRTAIYSKKLWIVNLGNAEPLKKDDLATIKKIYEVIDDKGEACTVARQYILLGGDLQKLNEYIKKNNIRAQF